MSTATVSHSGHHPPVRRLPGKVGGVRKPHQSPELACLKRIEAELKKVTQQLSAGKGSDSTPDAINKLAGELGSILDSLKNSGSSPNPSVDDLLKKIGEDIKALVDAYQKTGSKSSGGAGDAGGTGGAGSSSASDGSGTGAGSSTSNVQKPEWMKQETWDGLSSTEKKNIAAQDEQESHSMKMNMAMMSLQQKAQTDAQVAEAMSQLSRTCADAAMNTIRNIRA